MPDARVATRVVRAPQYGTSEVRATRDGVAYLCPHVVRLPGEDLAASTVRPAIVALELSQQLGEIVGSQGWRLTPSDKGQYAKACASLVGGDDQLLDVMSDPGWTALLAGLRSARDADDQPRGWDLKDGRVYLSLEELEAVRTEAKSAPTVAALLEVGVILRGLVFRCPLCSLKAWYGADELAERLRCSRCRRPFALTEPGWQPGTEPQWRYRLTEVFWQLLANNGDLPLRALRTVLGIGGHWTSGPTAVLHEHDLWPPDASSRIELDICAQRGAELWIGEAKLAPTLGTAKERTAKLAGLHRAAELLRPHGILLVTAATAWTSTTEQEARAALDDVTSVLRLVGCPPPSVSSDNARE